LDALFEGQLVHAPHHIEINADSKHYFHINQPY
jgi:hypothetical protein